MAPGAYVSTTLEIIYKTDISKEKVYILDTIKPKKKVIQSLDVWDQNLLSWKVEWS